MSWCLVCEHLQEMERPPPALTGKANLFLWSMASGDILAHSAVQTPCSSRRQPVEEIWQEVSQPGPCNRQIAVSSSWLSWPVDHCPVCAATDRNLAGLGMMWLRKTQMGETFWEPWSNLCPAADDACNYFRLSLLSELFTLLGVNKKDVWLSH